MTVKDLPEAMSENVTRKYHGSCRDCECDKKQNKNKTKTRQIYISLKHSQCQ